MSNKLSTFIFAALLCVCASFSDAQTAVTLAPVPIQQVFNSNGVPLAFGCIFAYQVNTTSPLDTYTDYTGGTKNANPVVLSGAGTYTMWLQAGVAYTLVVKSVGGVNCALGSTIATVNGIGGGGVTLTTVVPYSSTPAFSVAAQNQLFEITLTGNASAQPLTFVGVTPPSYIIFQITQDSSGGHTFSWPSNAIGGCTIGSAANQVTTQEFIYNGSNATAIGPCVTGNGPSISVGAITSSSLALFNGGFGCAQGTALTPVSGEDLLWCDVLTNRWAFSNNGAAKDLLVGQNTTDAFANKTFNAAVGGNILQINSNTVSAVTGTTNSNQTDVLAGNPTLQGWNCPVTTQTANYTLNSGATADCIVHVSAASGSITIKIPHSTTGQFWQIVRTDTTVANSVTMQGDSGNINNYASLPLPTNSVIVCHADGVGSWCTQGTGIDQWASSGGCTANGSPCTATAVNWGFNWPDTNYFVQCTATGEAANSSAIFWVSTKATSNFQISIDNRGMSNPGGYSGFDCHGHHN